MPRLHTLRVLRSVWQRQQLLLKLGRDINACEVGSLCPTHADFVTSLIAQEDALLLRLLLVARGMHSGDRSRVAPCRTDSKCSIDIPARLVELNRLPGVFGRLTDGRAVFYANDGLIVGVIWVHLLVRIAVLLMNVSLNLTLAEAQRQIELERLISTLPALRLLKARCI